MEEKMGIDRFLHPNGLANLAFSLYNYYLRNDGDLNTRLLSKTLA